MDDTGRAAEDDPALRLCDDMAEPFAPEAVASRLYEGRSMNLIVILLILLLLFGGGGAFLGPGIGYYGGGGISLILLIVIVVVLLRGR